MPLEALRGDPQIALVPDARTGAIRSEAIRLDFHGKNPDYRKELVGELATATGKSVSQVASVLAHIQISAKKAVSTFCESKKGEGMGFKVKCLSAESNTALEGISIQLCDIAAKYAVTPTLEEVTQGLTDNEVSGLQSALCKFGRSFIWDNSFDSVSKKDCALLVLNFYKELIGEFDRTTRKTDGPKRAYTKRSDPDSELRKLLTEDPELTKPETREALSNYVHTKYPRLGETLAQRLVVRALLGDLDSQEPSNFCFLDELYTRCEKYIGEIVSAENAMKGFQDTRISEEVVLTALEELDRMGAVKITPVQFTRKQIVALDPIAASHFYAANR